MPININDLSPDVIQGLQDRGLLKPGPLTQQAAYRELVASTAPQQKPLGNFFPTDSGPTDADVAAQRAGVLAAAQQAGAPKMVPPPAATTTPAAPVQVPMSRVGPSTVSRVSPLTREMMESGQAVEDEGTDEAGKAAVAANDAEAGAIDQYAGAMGRAQMGASIREQEHRAALDDQENEYKRLQSEADAGSIDRDRWWGSKNAGQKALAYVGMALSGFGSGIQRRGQGGNPAADLIQQKIRDDVDDQKYALDSKRKSADAAKSLYAMKLDRFKDERQADTATEAQMLQQYKLLGDAEVARAKSPQLAAQWKITKGQLDEKQAQLHASMESYSPGGVVGPTAEQKEIHKSAMLEALKAGNTVDEATAIANKAAGYGGGGGDLSIKQKGQPTGPAVDVPVPKSTDWQGVQRNWQGSDAYKNKLNAERWNAQVLAAVHKVNPAARSIEAMQVIGAPYLVKPGDEQATIAKKAAAFKADFPKAGPVAPSMDFDAASEPE